MRKILFRKGKSTKTLHERFWEKVNIGGPDECWIWFGNKQPKGYGLITVKGRSLKAHRLSWEMANGSQVPHGEFVCHRCNTPSCVNPKHLYVASNNENQADSWKRGTRVGAHIGCYGERSPSHKLTEEKAKEILALKKCGWKQKAIARHYGIHQSTVSDVVTGRCWPHLDRSR